jgi:hypothetical protein
MAEIGFVPAGEAWAWRGHRRPRRREPQGPRPGNAFAGTGGATCQNFRLPSSPTV